MRATVEQSALQEGVTLVQGIAQSKLSNPVVENIVLKVDGETTEILATNLSISIRVVLASQETQAGEIALPAKLFGQLVRELPAGPVSLELKGDEMMIEAGRSHFHLFAVSTEDFPPFLPKVDGPVLEIPVEVAAKAIERVVFASSDERSRFELGGVKLIHEEGKVQWAATDGRRLSLVKHDVGGESIAAGSILIPSRAAQEVSRALPSEGNLKVTLGEKRVLFEAGNITIASTLLTDNFPPWESLIPDSYSIHVTVGRDDLLSAVRRASVLANERSRLVELVAKDGTLEVRGERQEAGGGNTEIDAMVEGKGAEVSYNANYLIDCLRVMGEGKVRWSLIQSDGAGYLSPEDDDSYLHIIMPMTVREEEVPVGDEEDLEAED